MRVSRSEPKNTYVHDVLSSHEFDLHREQDRELEGSETTLDSELDQPGVALVSSTSLQLSGAITQYPGRGCTYQYRHAVRMEAVPIKLV